MSSAFCIIPNPDLRNDFFRYLTVNEFNWPMITTSVATIAAYNEGNPWRLECLKYIGDNISLVQSHISANPPSIKVIRPDASYLIWLDCRDFARNILKATPGSEDSVLSDHFTNRLRMALNNGAQFGPGGDGFMRLNAAARERCFQKHLTV